MVLEKSKNKQFVNFDKLRLGVYFNAGSNTEVDIIGNSEDVKSIISSAKSIHEITPACGDTVCAYVRPYGSLLFDTEHPFFPFRDCLMEMSSCASAGKNALAATYEKYTQLLPPDNVSMLYALKKVYEAFGVCRPKDTEQVYEFLDDIFLPPFKCSHGDSLVDAFKVYKKNYYKIFPAVYNYDQSFQFAKFADGEYCTTQNCDMFYIANYNILSIIKLYTADCAENNKYMKRCKNKQCGKLMLGNISGIKEYCSDKCREEAYQHSIEKRRDKLENVPYEAAFSKAYQRYYYYRNKKFKAAGLSDEQMFSFIKEFQILQEQMEIYRREIGAGRITEKEFFIWFDEQTGKVEEECAKLNKIINDSKDNDAK